LKNVITLSPSTLVTINRTAQLRQEQKRGRGQQNQKISPHSALETEIAGLKGEYAAAQYFGLEVDGSFVADKGYDLVINGYTVDIKYSSWPHGDLYFTSLSHFKADIGLLAVASYKGSPNTVRLAGWMPQDLFGGLCISHDAPLPGEKWTTWRGVGMTQSSLPPRKGCRKCGHHASPIYTMDSF
jgi:hypothetical protein